MTNTQNPSAGTIVTGIIAEMAVTPDANPQMRGIDPVERSEE